jgi:CubicO group peptidase (beta-lactamase class C family)
MRKFGCFIICILFLTLLIETGTPQQVAPNTEASRYAEAINAFEKFVIQQMFLDKVPGLSIGFIKDDFIWVKGYGYADLENRAPAKPESAYRLASVTKTMTAIAVLQLVEAGKIDLDAEVQTYVPSFPKKKWPVTVRLLLGHLGGISHYRNHDVESRIKVHKDTQEALAVFQDFELVARPGTRYNYSSYGYNLLGAVVEAASGMPYGDYIQKHIFEPLGMENSRMDNPADIIPNRVRGYRLIRGEVKNSEYVDISSRFAAGGTRSTVIDLLKYARGVMEGKLLREETWKQMFSSMATQAGFLTGYGMGWKVRPLKGHFQVSHGGGQPETTTYLLILPGEKFAVALGSNLERTNRLLYVYRLAELILDEDLDGSVYVSDRREQPIYNACYQVFSHGISRYDWLGRPLTTDDEELEAAFFYFNRAVDEKNLKNFPDETRKKIDQGIHLPSDRAFTRVGTFMASTLNQRLGKEKLRDYNRTGPIAFFNDYIKFSSRILSKKFRFDKKFARLISAWHRDWTRIYPESVRRLYVSVNTDFDTLGLALKKTFPGAKIYPDLIPSLTRVAADFRKQDNFEKSLQVLNLAADLYPESALPIIGLAATSLFTGNVEESRRLFLKARNMDSKHPRLNYIFNLASSLENADKPEVVFPLMKIATELFPKSSKLYKEIGNMYVLIGKIAMAIDNYKKALAINPKDKETREKLTELEKQIHE